MKLKQFLVIVLGVFTLGAYADEGMWTVDNFPGKSVKQKYGVDIDAALLDKLRLATTRLEGGCTGSFASSDGLLLTNHHCAQACIGQLSSAKNDLTANGFLAATRQHERQCPTEQVSVLVALEDVTDTIKDAIRGKTGAEANKIRKATQTRLENDCRAKAGDKFSCESVSLYNGGQYFLYTYRRYTDVRLVFAPEYAIAGFGGDPDNFNFPRWCLDMALLRVYEEGKPVQTPEFLSWNRAGTEKGEAVFVTGHPGATQRLLTVAQLRFLRDQILPDWLLRYSELRGRLIQYGTTSAEASRQIQQRLQAIENRIKVSRNQLAALLDERVFERKRKDEARLRAAVNADPALAADYADAWDRIYKAQQEFANFYPRYTFIESGAAFSGTLFGYARSLVRAAAEREKPESRRLREYTASNLGRLEQSVLGAQPIYPQLEQLQLAFSLEKLREQLGPDDAAVKLVLGDKTPRQLAQQLVDGTKLADPDYRRRLWEGGIKTVQAADDPLIKLAWEIDPQARALRKRYEDKVEAVEKAAEEQLAAARFAVDGTSTYPDATFTLRVTYGAVKGWDEAGTAVQPFTTVAQLYPRVTGQPPFALPPSWQQQKLADDTRFNFVATTDITGGNSGSPMVNAHGELVGLVFDGNIHSIAGAYFYDSIVNRTVAVHPAVMLAALQKIYHADDLIAEIGGK